jgi:hypothetical protein
MANIKISDLTVAGAASGTQEFEVNDSLISRKVTGAQIAAYTLSTLDSTDISGAGGLLAANNLSDIVVPATARTNLGLGTAALSAATDFVSASGDTMTGGLTVNNDAATVLTVDRATSDGTLVDFKKDGVTVGSIGTGASELFVGSGDVNLTFNSLGDNIYPSATGSTLVRDAAVDLGLSFARFKNLYLSGGVYLGGTGAENLLDDYETGTFTPIVADALTGGNIAAGGTFSGTYVKIGKVVTIQFTLLDINTTGMTAGNTLFVQNLPFTTSASNISAGSLMFQNVSFAGQPIAFLGVSRNYLYFREFSSGGTLSDLTVSDFTSGSADAFVQLSYEV